MTNLEAGALIAKLYAEWLVSNSLGSYDDYPTAVAMAIMSLTEKRKDGDNDG